MSRKFYSVLDKAVREIGFESFQIHTINAFLKAITETIKDLVRKMNSESNYTLVKACCKLEECYNLPLETCAELIEAYKNDYAITCKNYSSQTRKAQCA